MPSVPSLLADSGANVPTYLPSSRLHHKSQFDPVYKHGKRVNGPYFSILGMPNPQGPRLGMSISNKSVGNSVNRNRVKRIIRESFRQIQAQLPAIDIVVNSKPAAKSADNKQLRQNLEQHWIDIAQRFEQ